MPTRNVVLTDQQTEFIKQLVCSVRYQNVSEVLREGIRLIERQELDNEAHLKALRKAAKTGIVDIESGCFQLRHAPDGGAVAGTRSDAPCGAKSTGAPQRH